MEDAAVLSECFARVAAELSAMLSHDATVPNGTRADGEPADHSRVALEVYLHEMRKSEGLTRSTAGCRRQRFPWSGLFLPLIRYKQ